MLQTYFAARSARPIAAFLIMGSLTGFVVGQRLGHPVTMARHPVSAHTAAVAQHASGGLGTPVVHPLVQTLAAKPSTHPADEGGHGKHGKHDGPGDSNGGGGDGSGGNGGGDGHAHGGGGGGGD